MTSAFLIQNELMPRKVFDASRMASRQASSNPARDDRPGRAECYDCEYVRNGTANLFMAFEPLGGWRAVAVTDRRRREDWARFVRNLVDGRYREADKLVLVMDQLNIHSPASLYQAFAPEEAKRLADRLEIHHT